MLQIQLPGHRHEGPQIGHFAENAALSWLPLCRFAEILV